MKSTLNTMKEFWDKKARENAQVNLENKPNRSCQWEMVGEMYLQLQDLPSYPFHLHIDGHVSARAANSHIQLH